jgi:hypothetical protein
MIIFNRLVGPYYRIDAIGNMPVAQIAGATGYRRSA